MHLSADRHSELGCGYATALAAAVNLSTTGIIIRHLTQAYLMPALLLTF